MNIVKGVADLIRRTSSGQATDTGSVSKLERFSSPTPKIQFRDVGDEEVLNALWERYLQVIDKMERRKLFLIFLKQFLIAFKDWEPIDSGELGECTLSAVASIEQASHSDTIIGCSAGHPAEIILAIMEEVDQLTTLVSDLHVNAVHTTTDISANSGTLNTISEWLSALKALAIVTRSLYNCKVFGYYGGIQKLTALMKAAVVQLKGITGALSADEQLSTLAVEKMGILQEILISVVSITCSFIDIRPNVCDKILFFSNAIESSVSRGVASLMDPNSLRTLSETRLRWRQKATVSVMEAGGLNWLVELLRVIRRLSMKEQWTDISLQYLTLRTLHLALSENPRGQNHFRSIGGLEVLLDGLGLSSNRALALKNSSCAGKKREENPLVRFFQLHLLSLEVLRKAVFGNLNNLQFLCENGRVHKFANSFCLSAFLLQEYKQHVEVFFGKEGFQMPIFDAEKENHTTIKFIEPVLPLPDKDKFSFSDCWNDYAASLSRVLCSFLLVEEDSKSHQFQSSTARSGLPISSVYGELSIKWVVRVLVIVFSCIKACSTQNELPVHLRAFIYSMHHYVLYSFRKVLAASPALIEVFRDIGVWDLFFSENFFYFGWAVEEFPAACVTHDERSPRKFDEYRNSTNGQARTREIALLQMDIVSLVEFAATSNGSTHNLPECSVLLDALEQSACCNPEIACGLAQSLIRVLKLSFEKTVVSFNTLDAIPRMLKVTCVQAQESKRCRNIGPSKESTLVESVPLQSLKRSYFSQPAETWLKSMGKCMELFSAYLSVADGASSLILHNSVSIDCLFDLFWEEGLRNLVLTHILHIMKITPSSHEDQRAKLQLCSKYLQTFALLKEREKKFADLSIDLLVGMKDMLLTDQLYYQDLFREGECFLHVVSLLNANLDVENEENLVLIVLQTLTHLLTSNDSSKAAFRALVGVGYQTLQSLLLDFCQGRPSEALLNALLDMLVDGKFDIKASPVIKNEDVIILYLSLLQKGNTSIQHFGISIFQQLLKDSISNRASCVRAGMLNFLLDWFSQEGNEGVILKLGQLIQIIGGHSISGKDIRKIFALVRSQKVGDRQQCCLLLLSCISSMLNEKGPTAFYDLNGNDAGIVVETPIQWPLNKGFSFSCWLRVENFPRSGTMGLFSFFTENGKGCLAVLARDKLIYESMNLKHQCVSMDVFLARKKWHYLCITHSIGRAFSGGSLLRCYVDGHLVSSERCRYAKVNEPVTKCTVGAKLYLPLHEDDNTAYSNKDSSSFLGQIGPVYMFSDAISSEQVRGIFSLGPSYMYSFLDNEVAVVSSYNPLPGGILDAKDGLASKIIFGLNAQASDGKKLFNVSPLLDHAPNKNSFIATVLAGTQLCSRRLLQQIIYCVGGVSVFFPLFTQFDGFENEDIRQFGHTLFSPITRECLTAEVIDLLASVLDDNLANQQQLYHLSGFSILGFLLQSVWPVQLNLETLSALKRLFNVVANCGLSELLVKEAISRIFLNPLVWVYTTYKVQRELYMFLVQQFDNDPRLLKSLCRLPRVIDIIHQYYWDYPKHRSAIGSKPLLHPITKEVIGERPNKEEIRKIRLLLLSLGEMSLRQNISTSDIKSLIAFFETSQDMACIEDVLHMVIRAVSQKPLLAAFLEQVDSIGGCQIFVNLLQRDYEPIRLLSLQFLGRLLVGFPSEKKGPRFFHIAVGRPRFLSEGQRKVSLKVQTIFSSMSDRLFRFPRTEHLFATLFDVLLGGASPKQVLQKHYQAEKQKSKGHNTHFFLPQILVFIFRFLSESEDASARIKIIRDLIDLLDSNPSNIEALMENGWNAWLMASVRLQVFRDYKVGLHRQLEIEIHELHYVRSLYCIVLCHYLLSVKGGWQHLEETANFLLMHSEQGGAQYQYQLRDLYKDLILRLVDLSSEDNIFINQPCRDNTLYLLRLVDEMLVSELDDALPYPSSASDFSPDSLDLDSHKDLISSLFEALQGDCDDSIYRNPSSSKEPMNELISDEWWALYDSVWIIISEMNGKGSSRAFSKSPPTVGPSFGQRARGLVESLNIPAAEMAAVVVSGGIGNALGGKPNKNVDKAMLLRGEKCPRIVFRLVVLYLCRSRLERASLCVQQIISLLPCILAADDEQSKSRLQLFIWALLTVRSQYGMLNEGARFHVVSHLLRETVSCGKLMLATSIVGRDESQESGSSRRESGAIYNIIQKERVLAAVADEVNYIKMSKTDRIKQFHELRIRMEETFSIELKQKETFEDEMQSNLNNILAFDDSRRAAFQLTLDEEQQTVAEKWIHVFRTLIDERGPWSANPFPNSAIRHWKLDKTEDSWRRRPKLRQNYHFDEKLCFPLSAVPSTDATLSVSDNKFGLGSHIPEQMKQLLLKGIRRITDEGCSEANEDSAEINGQDFVTEDSSDSQSSELEKEISDHKGIPVDRKDSSSPLSDTETSEVLLSIPCVLVTPKRKLAGRLAVMKNVLHFFGEFLVEGTGGASVFKNFSVSTYSDTLKPDVFGIQKQKWPQNSSLDFNKGNTIDNVDAVHFDVLKQHKNVKRHRRWNICKIKAVHWTRYLLRYTAIEVFFNNSVAPIFLNFASQKIAKDVGALIVATRNESLFLKGGNKEKNGAISFVDRRVALELAEMARESWRRREMTNFEYLMILNTLSGRSYNDLTQYPVFPWVLADYSSDVIDFNKSSTFRDLSKPVGALESKRFEVFEDRYHHFCDPDIPSFYYGSHYSSMGIVLFYLLRMEPYTALHRNLQGGKFDHADRLFQSIEGTYCNCLSNTSDVKELIPEFFYMPEFLTNSNSYHMGVKQDGEPIGDVCLPPWAKGSPEEFINKNREALESEYVSSNLHLWIDLVFGYRQRGKPAKEAANIFYYLTYEGAVDLDTMEDDLQRSAVEDQIANFGQTPIQIFRKKHPRRGPPIPIAHPLHFAPNSINLTSIVSSASSLASAVLFIGIVDSNIVVINQGLTMSVKMWLTTPLQSGGNFTFSGSQDPFFGIGSDILSLRKIGSPLAETAEIGVPCFATIQTPSETFLISCGNWENSFQVISLADGRMIQSIRHHKDLVSCVAVTSDGNILATGSYDTTVMLWEVSRLKTSEKKIRITQSELPRKDCVIVETPFHILCGHDDIITCLFVSSELDIVISGSKDGTCVFHTLREGRYIRSLQHPSGSPLSRLVASQHGRIVFYAHDDLSLHLYSINGKHIATSESNGRLNSIELSACGDFLVCAGDQGQIVVRSMNSLQVVKRYIGIGKTITSLTVTPEECFLAGTKDGSLLVFSIENQQLRRGSLPQNVKYKAPTT